MISLSLSLYVNKTKELIVNHRKERGSTVERVSSFKFLGVHITEDLTWDEHASHVVKA